MKSRLSICWKNTLQKFLETWLLYSEDGFLSYWGIILIGNMPVISICCKMALASSSLGGLGKFPLCIPMYSSACSRMIFWQKEVQYSKVNESWLACEREVRIVPESTSRLYLSSDSGAICQDENSLALILLHLTCFGHHLIVSVLPTCRRVYINPVTLLSHQPIIDM